MSFLPVKCNVNGMQEECEEDNDDDIAVHGLSPSTLMPLPDSVHLMSTCSARKERIFALHKAICRLLRYLSELVDQGLINKADNKNEEVLSCTGVVLLQYL